MSDDRPDGGAPQDPRPSGRIRIVGATPATGEQHAVPAPPSPPPTPEPPAADDPNRFGAIPIISADEPPEPPAPAEPPTRAEPVAPRPAAEAPRPAAVPDPEPEPTPEPPSAPAEPPARATGPTPVLDDLDLPATAAVPAVPAEEDLDDVRIWAAPDDEDDLLIEAGRSAQEDPFSSFDDDDEDPYAVLAAEAEDLPHWSEPPTGAAGQEEDLWASGVSSAPRWRGQGEESGEPDDFADLMDETRVEPMGADEIVFDDVAGDPLETVEPAAGPPQRRRSSPYPEADEEFAELGGGGGGGGERNMQQAIAVGGGLVVLLLIASFLGAWALVGLATVIIVMATAEFMTAMRRSGYHPAVPVALAGSAGMVLAAYWRGEGAIPLVMFLVVVTTLCWWLFDAGPGDHAVANAGITILGVMYIGGLGAFAALLLKFPDGVGMLFGAILVAVAADIGGLFVGQRMGNAPLIAASPNKTMEGFLGGIVVAVVASVVVLGIIGVFPWDFMDALVLGVVGGVMTPLGDLCESRIKRDLGVKDMGDILPGHGGVLDRFDGLLFVLPATYYVVRLLEVYANTP